jgi:hypothetical protein
MRPTVLCISVATMSLQGFLVFTVPFSYALHTAPGISDYFRYLQCWLLLFELAKCALLFQYQLLFLDDQADCRAASALRTSTARVCSIFMGVMAVLTY